MRGQKGITLVALIITIIVLLILAVVAIAAVTDGGIINHAQNARTEYQDEQKAEMNVINGYVNYLNNEYTLSSGSVNQ